MKPRTTMKKLGPVQQWMQDHPDDVPCPKGGAGQHWRRARGLDQWHNTKMAKRALEKRPQLLPLKITHEEHEPQHLDLHIISARTVTKRPLLKPGYGWDEETQQIMPMLQLDELRKERKREQNLVTTTIGSGLTHSKS